MSYGGPPAKTPYGDSDFIKEDYTAQPPGGQPIQDRRDPRLGPNSTFARPAEYAANQPLSVNNQGPLNAQEAPNVMPTMTPEDRIFLRSWRQDSFYYRVLPLAVIGSGGLYYYNQLKKLPHKASRYFAVSVLSYVLGKMSYKGELERRLQTTPLNTPFIQALRKMTGISPSLSSMGEFSGDGPQDSGAGWNAGGSSFPGPIAGSYSQTPHTAYGQYSQGPQNSYQPYDSDLSSQTPPNSFGNESPKSFTNYEELRAKNRGLIQK